MALCSNTRCLKIYDIKRKDPKLISNCGTVIVFYYY